MVGEGIPKTNEMRVKTFCFYNNTIDDNIDASRMSQKLEQSSRSTSQATLAAPILVGFEPGDPEVRGGVLY